MYVLDYEESTKRKREEKEKLAKEQDAKEDANEASLPLDYDEPEEDTKKRKEEDVSEDEEKAKSAKKAKIHD